MLNQVLIKGIMLSEGIPVTLHGGQSAIRLSVTTNRVVRRAGKLAKSATSHYVLVIADPCQRCQLLKLPIGTQVEVKGRMNEVLLQEKRATPYKNQYLIEATGYVKTAQPQPTPAL